MVHEVSDGTEKGGLLEAAEIRWERTFSAAVDPMLIVDDEQRLIDANSAASALLGYSRDELSGHRVENLIAPRHRDRIPRAWARFILAGEERGEWLLITRAGHLVEVEVSAAANIVAGSHLIVMRDITARKLAEAEAQQRNEQQAAAAEMGRMALSEASSRELMQRAAEEVARILEVELVGVLELGAEGRDLVLRVGVGWTRATVGEEPIAATSSLAGFALASPNPVIVEDLGSETRFDAAPLLRKHGVVSGLNIVIEGGERPFGLLGVYSRRPRAFSADDVHFVQGVANVLGAALARERLQRLEDQIQQSRRLESIGQLAGGIAHDFNNLLAVILNYSNFALEELDPDAQAHRDVSEVAAAAEHGADLTKQLLLFSSRQVVQTRTVDPNQVVGRACAILERTIGEHIELGVSYGSEVVPVRLGHGQLEQILMNLAMNGRDAMPDGGLLSIETEKVELDEGSAAFAGGLPPGTYVLLSVGDSGVGMNDEVAKLAFEPFFTTKERSKGTGLGLATVYGIAQTAGGWVEIDSEPGRGTEVRVYLPASGEGEVAEVAATPSRLQGLGERILVVEDDDAIRRATERILTQNGYAVTTATVADKAIGISGEARFDLLLTDVVLPTLSGIDLAERVRARQPQIAVVYTSGYAEDSLPFGAALADDALVVEKPFTASSLLAGVRAGLDAEPTGQAAQPAA